MTTTNVWHLKMFDRGGGHFAAYHLDERLVTSMTPFIDAARALLQRGANPEDMLSFSHAGSATVAMRSTVGQVAAMEVEVAEGRLQRTDTDNLTGLNRGDPVAASAVSVAAAEAKARENYVRKEAPPLTTAEEYLEAGYEPMSPIKALRAKCLDCSGGSYLEVMHCQVGGCPSYPFRLGHDPWRKKAEVTEAQRAEKSERMRAINARKAAKSTEAVP